MYVLFAARDEASHQKINKSDEIQISYVQTLN